MIGVVIVSHSAKLAEGVCELAGQVAQGQVRLVAAGGTGDPNSPLGTDAFKVFEAIESVYSEDGVLVLMDLGSAVLSAETALDLLDEEKRARVVLCPAPLVEGAVAAVSQAVAGASLAEAAREAQSAMTAKETHLGAATSEPAVTAATAAAQESHESLIVLPNRLGLHARPAAQLVRLARGFDARVTLENLSEPAGPVDAGSINGLLSLGARRHHQLRIRASGAEARQAVAAVSAFIESGCGDPPGDENAPAADSPPQVAEAAPGQLAGIPASPGIAVGPLAKLEPARAEVAARHVDDPEAERQRLLTALSQAQDDTRALYDWARRQVGEVEAGIFDAQLLFLEDPVLLDDAVSLILSERLNAESAWQTATGRLSHRLTELSDSYLRGRAADVTDVAERVLRRLAGRGAISAEISEPSIVTACDLTPSEVKNLDPHRVLGLCLDASSASAHSVILARSMGIPAVVGLGPGLSAIEPGTTVALDGERGVVWMEPDVGQLSILESRRAEWLAAREAASSERHKPACTKDGQRIRVFANISGVADAGEAVELGAEGVGVLRTEFLFLGRKSAPSEEEQYAAYDAIARSLGGRTLSIRTLDVGGDKDLPYIRIGEEANPFLGLRGLRLTLDQGTLFRTQLRAILRAGADHSIELLFPMVSTLAELRAARTVLSDVSAELEKEGLPFGRGIRVGVMIEVPAAAVVADLLAREVDYLSIGTNDLVQYVMAADRTNARVAAIADPFQPAVLRMIRQTASAGKEAGISVAICGELAANTVATPLLLGLGVDEFSVSAPFIPELKRAIRRWEISEAESAAREALALDSSESVREYLMTLEK